MTRKSYGTRDPFELLDAMKVVVRFSDKFTELRGCCMQVLQTKYVVINSRISSNDQLITAGHECGHIVEHSAVLRMMTFKDEDLLYTTDKMEYEANMFSVNLLIPDAVAQDALQDLHGDAFAVAQTLRVPQQFLTFKLHSMMQRGIIKGDLPMGLDSRFMGKKFVI